LDYSSHLNFGFGAVGLTIFMYKIYTFRCLCYGALAKIQFATSVFIYRS